MEVLLTGKQGQMHACLSPERPSMQVQENFARFLEQQLPHSCTQGGNDYLSGGEDRCQYLARSDKLCRVEHRQDLREVGPAHIAELVKPHLGMLAVTGTVPLYLYRQRRSLLTALLP